MRDNNQIGTGSVVFGPVTAPGNMNKGLGTCAYCGQQCCKCYVPITTEAWPGPPPISGKTLYANIADGYWLVVWPTGCTSYPTREAAEADAKRRAAGASAPVYILRPVQKAVAAREVTVTDLA